MRASGAHASFKLVEIADLFELDIAGENSESRSVNAVQKVTKIAATDKLQLVVVNHLAFQNACGKANTNYVPIN